ncbi:MAG: hypothetical protein JXB39_08940 [Deltaproteobacteria bacterium]|nr:hypothetical protein [Deltaproteobacteria bacterium]
MHPDRTPAPSFHLSRGALEEVRTEFATAVREGLARDGAEIAAFPAFLPPLPPHLAGWAIAVDVGGTHVRAALVAHGPGGTRVEAGPISGPVVRGRPGAPVPCAAFFGCQADLVASLAPPPGLPLGYCFSYPATVLPGGDARLVRWTKGVEVVGVEGREVGALLAGQLALRGVRVSGVRVLNDTVAVLLAGDPGPDARAVGLVAGTGTNMAILAPAVPKVPDWNGPMAVNLESGAFRPSHLTRWDEAVDASSVDPGCQRFEKAVSGQYLPLLFRAASASPERIGPGDGGEALVRIRTGTPGEDADLAAAILDRSADLVAAGLVAAADVLGGPPSVVAEGSLFWRSPGYRERVEGTARTLLGLPEGLSCTAVPDATLVGAARAALLPRGGST